MQFQVPQNIDIEDKIVGPLTLLQFLYLIGGGIICYLLFMWSGGNYIFWLLGLPIALVALALAFLKVQDQPLSYFIKAGFFYLSRPKIRLWKRYGISPRVILATPAKKSKSAPAPKRKIEKSELEKLAYTLDTQGKTQNLKYK